MKREGEGIWTDFVFVDFCLFYEEMKMKKKGVGLKVVRIISFSRSTNHSLGTT